MEVTFLPGLEGLGERLLSKKRDEQAKKGETVWEAYMRRKRWVGRVVLGCEAAVESRGGPSAGDAIVWDAGTLLHGLPALPALLTSPANLSAALVQGEEGGGEAAGAAGGV